ncbi:hypothetical protein HC723_09470 [Vibrio sp. S11_S32]|uniref:hypothetical protein n=1 Tax=Vibrio sp. S11_S32 TaxID=2720225 RepID=UPI0016812C5C|nr:hypothetical protein [Vibrio sp. S11_S32]MBD1576665.1 hypothetical protein [Vibrio sp. S11_S32]
MTRKSNAASDKLFSDKSTSIWPTLWQDIVDLVAEISHASAALIMRNNTTNMAVLVSSQQSNHG